jgi:hypothetical protein
MIPLSAPGNILLTAGVGGPAAKFKDKFLSRAIIMCQRAQMRTGKANYSHAELMTDYTGSTFAARWRTRTRDNGLSNYIGSQILVGRPTGGMLASEFYKRWDLNEMDAFDGDIYPIHRILLAGLTSLVLPAWFIRINLFGKWAMCSEVVSCFFMEPNAYSFCQTGYKGIFPGDLEEVVKYGDEFEVVFEGVLTNEIMENYNLDVQQKEK